MIKETETPTRPWSRLTADFLEMPKIKDPNSNEELDELLVIVDTFSKMTILIPTKKTATCEEIFHLFWERVFSVFGIPDSVLSDRDKIFKTQKWRELMRKIGSEQKLSTAYHQQTDGQTERKIQELRAYYRHYLEYEQKNWRELTPIAQYAVNDAVNSERRRECKHRQDPQFYYVRHPKNTRKRKMRRRDRQHTPTNNGKTAYRSTKRPSLDQRGNEILLRQQTQASTNLT